MSSPSSNNVAAKRFAGLYSHTKAARKLSRHITAYIEEQETKANTDKVKKATWRTTTGEEVPIEEVNRVAQEMQTQLLQATRDSNAFIGDTLVLGSTWKIEINEDKRDWLQSVIDELAKQVNANVEDKASEMLELLNTIGATRAITLEDMQEVLKYQIGRWKSLEAKALIQHLTEKLK